MAGTILITGGAGFIGSHVARELLAHGYAVRALDVLDPQVHGTTSRRPPYLADDVELIVGDVRDPAAVAHALEGADAVFHFAAAVGVGQSMYRIRDFTAVNDLGTACVLEGAIAAKVQKLIVASSMSIYGEGLYVDADGAPHLSARRTQAALAEGHWEPKDAKGRPMTPRPTPESKPAALESVYALGKYAQEQAALIVGRAYSIPTVALRFFNVYGPHQALSNPYTGMLAIFASRLLNARSPIIFEDGQQRRDLVHVQDVAKACRLALESDKANGHTFNIGSGQSYSVVQVAQALAQVMGREDLEPEITREYRVGDIRHCFADVSHAKQVLGFVSRIGLKDGMRELADWLVTQEARDHVASARRELQQRGSTR
jgi:dTDP-L-rhamnose 4-epimerase